MTVQTTYATEHASAYAGMIADGQLRNAISKLNKTGATIEYGKGVFSDGENAMKLGATGATSAQFVGVVIRELNRAYAPGETFGAPDMRDGSVLTEGVIWVKAAEAVAKDDPVFVRVGATNTGDFAKVAGTGATEAIEVKGAKFLTAATAAGQLVKISLGLGG